MNFKIGSLENEPEMEPILSLNQSELEELSVASSLSQQLVTDKESSESVK